jgi:hypothetical protein
VLFFNFNWIRFRIFIFTDSIKYLKMNKFFSFGFLEPLSFFLILISFLAIVLILNQNFTMGSSIIFQTIDFNKIEIATFFLLITLFSLLLINL